MFGESTDWATICGLAGDDFVGVSEPEDDTFWHAAQPSGALGAVFDASAEPPWKRLQHDGCPLGVALSSRPMDFRECALVLQGWFEHFQSKEHTKYLSCKDNLAVSSCRSLATPASFK